MWGRENPVIAQECLNLPTTDPISSRCIAIKDWPSYWEWRNWGFSNVSSNELPHAQALTTHVLSAPLTVATHAFGNLSSQSTQLSEMRLLCIGARAESMLPVEYWRELLVLWDAMAPTRTKCKLVLSFLGPEIVIRPPVTFTYKDHLSLELNWLYKGKLHEYVGPREVLDLDQYHAFVFLNPGFGHPYLMQGWKPTLNLILKQQSLDKERIILMSAHSKLDTDRDSSILEQEYAPLFTRWYSDHKSYQENPFASRITYQDEDPAEPLHFVRPNQYCRILTSTRTQ